MSEAAITNGDRKKHCKGRWQSGPSVSNPTWNSLFVNQIGHPRKALSGLYPSSTLLSRLDKCVILLFPGYSRV